MPHRSPSRFPFPASRCNASPIHSTRRAGRRRPARFVGWAVAVAGLLAIAACGDSEDSADSGAVTATTEDPAGDTDSTTTSTVALAGGANDAGGEPTTTPAPAETAPPPTSAAETTTTAASTTTVPADPDPAGCLVGRWRVRDDSFFEAILASVPTADGFGGIEYVSGDYFVTFGADGATQGERLAWTFKLLGDEGNLITTIDSVDPGTYEVDGDEISLNDSGASTTTVKVQVEIGGVVQDLPTGAQSVSTPGVTGSGTFSCDDEALTVTLVDLPDAPPEGFTVAFDRA
ncbi:MAG: hypothetical protein AAFP84_06575 [Actinomycetota bacterium]